MNSLFDTYNHFRETTITHRRFKHLHLEGIIQQLPFEKEIVGFSFEERSIYKIVIGNGPIQVLLWSQMHGDEATATMAMLDIFRFFQASDDGFDAFRQLLKRNLTLHFVPMLNPDGAERFQRRTAQEIDMNRDAVALQTPEGRLLKQLQDSLKPNFSFNLHDKKIRYSAGNSPKQATISFLATAFNEAKDWNENRTRSMQVIGAMNETLQPYLPEAVGRWADDYEPRAFGDNIQKWGSSLILIESGGYKGDREKQFIRKLNYVAILSGLKAIADESYTKYSLSDYEKLPQNANYLFDLLIRNVTFEQNGISFKKDIGIFIEEKNIHNATDFVFQSKIEDMGDLSIFWGIEELDAEGLTIHSFDNFPELKETYSISHSAIGIEEAANFILCKENKPTYLVVNGEVVS